MKKTLGLLLAATFCLFSASAFADGGVYSVDSVSITPPAGGVVWDGTNPANLEIGTTYDVDMHLVYTSEGSDDDWYNTLMATLAFNGTGISFSDEDNAGDILSGSEYDFFFNIPVTEAMADVSTVTASFAGGYDGWNDLNFTFNLPVNVSAPVPEPSTLLLLGAGIVGLVGYNRRKKA